MGQPQPLGALQGKTAIVTGSTSGIGAAIAAAFAREGARVVVTGRRTAEGQAVAARIGPRATFVRADLTDDGELRELVAGAAGRFGRIDCLVNNAGTPGHAVSITDLPVADFDHAHAVHVRAPLLLLQEVSRHMVPHRSGSIINVASVSGLRAGFSGHDYSVAKAGLLHLTRCAAVELGESGIRVNTVSPGPVATGIHRKATGHGTPVAEDGADEAEPLFARFLPRWQPCPEVGRAEDVAEAAVFLAGDGARFVNGQNLTVDGALTAGRPWSTVLDERRAMQEAARDGGHLTE
ncbi:SDR family NAD(P)-dependent oxidoreductase [Streptomyces iconiensis]|uniref:SDR family oxidoreductase n=1 Tax=Streptomyces iconiensis TaxID=1384038 RepID=A0ABT7A390_9ACTN|nr:SDR family oxidoreductase [Streptomyces iconiensis]MDJ1135795.1 SDR family oxidoreductase [Streptomyces iconiensis]